MKGEMGNPMRLLACLLGKRGGAKRNRSRTFTPEKEETSPAASAAQTTWIDGWRTSDD